MQYYCRFPLWYQTRQVLMPLQQAFQMHLCTSLHHHFRWWCCFLLCQQLFPLLSCTRHLIAIKYEKEIFCMSYWHVHIWGINQAIHNTLLDKEIFMWHFFTYLNCSSTGAIYNWCPFAIFLLGFIVSYWNISYLDSISLIYKLINITILKTE